MGRQVVVGSTKDERKHLRSTLGPLKDLKVSASVAKRYDRAVHFFIVFALTAFGTVAESYAELDRHVSAYIQELWESGDSKFWAADTLSGLYHKLQVKKVLPVSWNWLSVWDRHEMPWRSGPLNPEQILAMAGLYFAYGLPEMAALVIVGFHCMLRTAEVLAIRRCHVSFANKKASIVLAGKSAARTGHTETVMVDDSIAVLMLRSLSEKRSPMEKLHSRSPYSFRKLWRWAIKGLDLDPDTFKPYSMRRGGATDDWARHQDAGRLVMRGRWTSLSTAKNYAVEGLRVRDAEHLSESHREKVLHWSMVAGQHFAEAEKLMKAGPDSFVVF